MDSLAISANRMRYSAIAHHLGRGPRRGGGEAKEGSDHDTRSTLYLGAAAIAVSGLALGVRDRIAAQNAGVAIDEDDIGRRLDRRRTARSRRRLIAENQRSSHPYAKMVVTDDKGAVRRARFPTAQYTVGVRGTSRRFPKVNKRAGQTAPICAPVCNAPQRPAAEREVLPGD